jgi:putative membrane protein
VSPDSAHAAQPNTAQQDPRNYFAAERTFLAWLRTGLALMGFGFVVARFGLFLRELAIRQPQAAPVRLQPTGPSLWLGTGLVALGVMVNVTAALRHVRQVRTLAAGTWHGGQPSRMGVGIAFLLAAAGVGLTVYLLLVH